MDIDPKLVDAGKQCPCCGYLGQMLREVALGNALFVCPRCNECHFDMTQEAA